MPTWELIAGWTTGRISGAVTTQFMSVAGAVIYNPTEARAQAKVYSNYTWANLYARIVGFSASADVPIRSRVGAANGNMLVTCTGTGVFQDTVNTDSLVDQNLIDFSIVLAPAGTISPSVIGSTLQDTGTNKTLCLSSGDGSTLASASTRFPSHDGMSDNSDYWETESDAQYTIRRATTYSNFRIVVATNNLNGATTLGFQVNTLAVNQTLSVSGSSTGAFEDTTNSDAIVVGDEINYKMATAGSAGAIGVTLWQMLHTSIGREMAATNDDPGFGLTGDHWMVSGGNLQSIEITQSETQIAARAAFTAKNLFVNVKTHGATGGVNYYLQVNDANSALTLNVADSTTGLFEDTTNSVDIAVADTYNYLGDRVGAANAIAPTVVGMEAGPVDVIGKRRVGFGAGRAIHL